MSIWRAEYVYDQVTCKDNSIPGISDGLLHQNMGEHSVKDRMRDLRTVLPHHAGNNHHVRLPAYVGLCDDRFGNVLWGIPCKLLSCGCGNGA